MRAQLSVLYVLTYTVGALAIADQWLDVASGSPKVVVTTAVAALMVLVALTQLRIASSAARTRVRTREAEEAAASERARVAAEIHATIHECIHAIVVEVVAAQQAVVRGAYGDDILTRLNSADESAHTALGSLDRLLEVSEPAADPAKTAEAESRPVPVA
jgi:signal transduction histidine kinase